MWIGAALLSNHSTCSLHEPYSPGREGRQGGRRSRTYRAAAPWHFGVSISPLRIAAGNVGLFTQSRERRDRYGEPSRLLTMLSQPSPTACDERITRTFRGQQGFLIGADGR
jgi:hypothetical protein